jgi:hypothetical protein
MIPVTARNFGKKAFLQIKQTNPADHQDVGNRRRRMREATEVAITMHILVLFEGDKFKFFPNLVEDGLVIIAGLPGTVKILTGKAEGLSMG